MNFLYHIVKGDVEGGVLYPLNALKERYPSFYKTHSKKYDERKHIPKLYIPQLDCYWGDVLHFSAIHPKTILQKLIAAGGSGKHPIDYYEIDPASLDPSKTIVYPNRPREHPKETSVEDFVAFDPNNIQQWSHFPDETLRYYEEKFSKGERPLLFLFVPHILYKGNIDVRRLERKQVDAIL